MKKTVVYAYKCTDARCTCIPRSCLRSIGGGWGAHRSAQCMEANLCHCSSDLSAQRQQGVKFKLLLQPGNSIMGGRICRSGTYWLSSLCKGREKVRKNGWPKAVAMAGEVNYYPRLCWWPLLAVSPQTATPTINKIKAAG